MDRAEVLVEGALKLSKALSKLRFAAPVTHVYDPLDHAAEPHAAYLRRYATGKKRVVYLGMNPGPFGMVQTGVPFGEVGLVKGFLGIEGHVGKPKREHPARPVDGFACKRSEVSGARLWGAIKDRHGTAKSFFKHAFVSNYCPLAFMEAKGTNRTPDKLPADERAALYALCDAYLGLVVDTLEPSYVIGIGKFAEDRARAALGDRGDRGDRKLVIATILHPSPASPAANRGWIEQVDAQLAKLDLTL